MLGYDSKLKLKELLVFIADQELSIEKTRQILAGIRDFEPYSAFKRIDRNNSGYVSAKEICQFQRENGYRELSPEDFIFMITYFDLDGDGKLNYHDFLQVLLPCDNPFLRSAATQRPNQELHTNEFLPMRVERAMSQLIFKEVTMHLKAENIKRSLESSYDFSIKSAFKAVDDWNYSYIDKQNLKRFLRSMGHLASKSEIIAILRRFDLDGDAKVNMVEFGEAIKTQLAASKPIKLRNQELELEKARNAQLSGESSKIKSRSISRKRNTSAYGPRNHGPNMAYSPFASYNQGGILKENRKKSRPKTGGKVSSKTPIFQNETPPFARQTQFDQYQVDQPAFQYQQEPFRQNHPHQQEPRNIYPEQISRTEPQPQRRAEVQQINNFDNNFPLRGESPRRTMEIRTSARYEYNQHSRQSDKTSPLRASAPQIPQAERNTYQNQIISQEQPPRRVGGLAGNIGQYDRMEQSEFAQVLKDNIFLERELEAVKIELALKTDFNLLDAFKIFDARGAGNISIQDITIGLRDILGVSNFNHDDVYLLFRRHDANSDGKLNFSEFSNMILPISKEYAALLTDRPDFYMSRNVPITQFFNTDTRNQFRTLWTAFFKCERESEQLRLGLRNRPYFNLKAAFAHLDRTNSGSIGIEELRDFLANNGFFGTEREIAGLIIKADRIGDMRINFHEFVDEFQPKLGF